MLAASGREAVISPTETGKLYIAFRLIRESTASEMMQGEEIARGILPVPEYITSAYRYNAELDKYQRRIDQSIPRETIGKTTGGTKRSLARMRAPHGKYIIFGSS